MFVTVIALKYASFVSDDIDIFLKIMDSNLFEQHDKSSHFNSAHCVVLYPQNGDRIVTIDSVTSLHPMYTVYYNTQGELTSQNLWSRYTRHFVGITWYYVWTS